MNEYTMAILAGADLEDLLALAEVSEEEFRKEEE